jgi:hypothetical protein
VRGFGQLAVGAEEQLDRKMGPIWRAVSAMSLMPPAR